MPKKNFAETIYRYEDVTMCIDAQEKTCPILCDRNCRMAMLWMTMGYDYLTVLKMNAGYIRKR